MTLLWCFLAAVYLIGTHRLTFLLGRDVNKGEIETWDSWVTKIGFVFGIVFWPIVVPTGLILTRLKLI